MTSASTFVRRRWRHRQPATSLSRTPDKRATIWLREKEPAQAVPWAAASRVVHLQFDGRTLYALDADARQIVALPPPGQSRSSAQVPRIGDPSLGDLRAFSPFRGIYYVSNGAALFALAPGGFARRVPCTGLRGGADRGPRDGAGPVRVRRSRQERLDSGASDADRRQHRDDVRGRRGSDRRVLRASDPRSGPVVGVSSGR
jgi:hypothetical protein